MSFSLNDVSVIPLANHGALIRVQSSSAPTPESSQSPVEDKPEAYTRHGNKQHDDGVPFTVVPVVAIFFTFAYLIVKAVMAPFTNRSRYTAPAPTASGGLSEEEIAILQKLQRTLSQMESRVEALETILIDQARTEKNYGSKF